MNNIYENLKSKKFDVITPGFAKQGVHWWINEHLTMPDSDFYYPYILSNLISTSKQDLIDAGIDANKVKLLCDSGGWQSLRNIGDLDWKSSLLKQIELGAFKIFAFDVPPVRRINENLNVFKTFDYNNLMKIVENNIDVAINQSKFLEQYYPKEREKMCYVMQCTSIDTAKANVVSLKNKLGGLDNNFSEYKKMFPGGICISCKPEHDDIFEHAVVANYMKKTFIDKGIYCHYLGMGSVSKYFILIRNEISSFDSSTSLQAAKIWSFNSPTNVDISFGQTKDNWWFERNFCNCPSCSKIDINKIFKENPEMVGRLLVKHNVYQMLRLNVFLDGLKKDKYTEAVKECFKDIVNDRTILGLEFADFSDQTNFDMALEKYKSNLRVDKSKQNILF